MTQLNTGSPRWSLLARVEVVALILTMAVGLFSWGAGIRHRGYDYDEVTRAHSIWLASRGLRPYGDFFECHPPYFAILAPIVRSQADPLDALLALRLFSAVGNLLFLGAVGAIAASVLRENRRWAWLGLTVVAFTPDVLRFLIEFRIDGWGYAIAAWALYRYRRPTPAGAWREFELGVVAGLATLLFSPKLTILPALVVAIGQLKGWESARRAFRAALAYSAGTAVAVGLFCLYLGSQGIDFRRMTELLVRYHGVGGTTSSFRLGLIWGVLDQRALACLLVAGLVAWGVDCGRRRRWPGAYELALLAWLAAQGLLVAYPYKQYYAPWFLFATAYLGFLGQGTSRWLDRARLIPFLLACVATGHGAIDAGRAWIRFDESGSQGRLIRWIDRVADPDDRVVACPPLHPIDRFDTFFVWFNTADLNGFDSEQILARLPSYREKVADGRFLAELEAHPPAVVVLLGDERIVPRTAGQEAALADFLPRRGYRTIRRGTGLFAVRPDRLDRARRAD